MVTASVTPALAVGMATPPSNRNVASPPLATSSAELRFGALKRLNSSAFRKKAALESEPAASFAGYIDGNRTTNASFRTDQRLAARTGSTAPEIAAWLAASDRNLARTAIDDAERTVLRWARESRTFSRQGERFRQTDKDKRSNYQTRWIQMRSRD